MRKKVEYLIVGQGLAGTFLAFQLLSRNISFAVVDNSRPNTASKVAAGLINPVALRRLIPSWRAQEFLNYNIDFYTQLGAVLGGKKYHHKIAFKKLIESKDERLFWEKKMASGEVDGWVEPSFSIMTKSMRPKKDFKLGAVKQCYWLNVKQLLGDFSVFLKENGLLLDEKFEYASIDEKVFSDVKFKKVVFCEGIGIKNNPYFNYLPYRINKGELLTVTSMNYRSECAMKKKMFVLPLGNNRYKIGATYAWEWEDEKPEEKSKSLLKDSLKEITQAEFDIENHEAGFRPAVKDRRPLIGAHPEHKDLFLFNGMGSRGCLIAPKLAKELVDHIENRTPLTPETDIRRYEKLSKIQSLKQ